ncbi:hypothetical protein [Aquabacter cavernae]|uniref:hypothetical protein n=1 Tax=Aquabacter cavernae TaxID=2496029 RepID=UPI000F8EB2CA|nr:hypothetical protein [Aquabacter cavernae]
MGTLIAFLLERNARQSARVEPGHGADIVILPVVRIERQEAPASTPIPLPSRLLEEPRPDTSGRKVR